MTGNTGDQILMLSGSLGLLQGEVAASDDAVLYGSGYGRGKTENASVGDQVILVSESVAQGSAELLNWNSTNDGASPGVTYPWPGGVLRIQVDGGNTTEDGIFPSAWRSETLSYPIDVTWEFGNVSWGGDPDRHHNHIVGLTEKTEPRLFEGVGDDSNLSATPGGGIYYIQGEVGPDANNNDGTFDPDTDQLKIREPSDGGADFQVTRNYPFTDLSNGSIRIKYDGSTVELYRNGVQIDTVSFNSNNTYRGGVTFEDDIRADVTGYTEITDYVER